MARNECGEPLDDALIKRGAGVDAVRAHRMKELVGEMIERIRDLRGGLGRIGEDGNVHGSMSCYFKIVLVGLVAKARQSRRLNGTPLIRVDVAALARMRSLLIMI